MGQPGSKGANSASFDQIRSSKKSVGGRQKNVPVSASNKPLRAERSISATNEKPLRFVETTMLIWLDASLEKPTDSNQKSLAQFRRATNIVEIFTELEKCFNFVNSVKHEKIYFVVSGSLGPQIVPRIDALDQIQGIYIFCGNKANHEQWTKQYKKIKGIHTRIKDLSEAIRYEARQYDKSITSISILPPATVIELNEANKEFIYLQVMKSILLEMHYDKKFQKDFLEFSRPFYLNNEQQVGIIDTFETNYNLHSPIWWYTRYCFMYSMLRKAFYHHDFELIYKLAFFIRDLHRDIKKCFLQTHNHQFHPITVYRATTMTSKEFENINKNQGALLSFNDFVLTTLERTVAIKFAQSLRSNPDSVSIIYKINIDPEVSSVPYIALNNLTYLSNTNGEILFSMNTIFHIDKIEKIHEHLFEIILFPANKKDEQIKGLVEYMLEVTAGVSGWYKLSRVLMEVKEYNQVEHIYKHIFGQTSNSDREERAFLQHELGYIYDLKDNLPTSVDHYKQAIQIYLAYLPPNHPTLSITYTNLASVLEKQGDLNGAFDQYQQALKTAKPDDPDIALHYNNIGANLQKQGKYAEAQQTYEKAIQILLQDFPSAYPILADTYHNIGGLFYSMKDYAKALNYYEKSLAVEEKFLPANHPTFVSTYYNLATTYEALKESKKAIKYAEKSAETARRTFGEQHLETKETTNYVEKLRQQRK
jgi:tetratricopeptide (TPR) repeat protein